MKAVLALLLLAAVYQAQALNWAVLVAGSNTYGNYRHQSDICHAFQIMSKNGIPAERIIVMQYDDIAHNAQNPYPGKIFNKPTPVGTPGVDVYAGCQKDYVGAEVTATNVINVLTGQAQAMQGIGNGKVLKSGPNDNVFFFYSDHGTVGEVEMPVGGPLYASKFNAALQLMHSRNMYAKMVVYIESCESGSMYNNLLPPNINIYATSASSPTESSWGCYCPPQDKVDGKSINSCLGDLYSVNWMEDTDKFGMTRTLQDQFIAVRTLTTMSKVMQWGDITFTNLTLGSFMGDKAVVAEEPVREYSGAEPVGFSAAELREMSAVSTYDIPMHLAYYSYLRHDTDDIVQNQALLGDLISELNMRKATDSMFIELSTSLAGSNAREALMGRNRAPINWPCIDGAKAAYRLHCGEFTDYARKYVRVMNNLCLMGVSAFAQEGVFSRSCPLKF
jgi:legumain